MKKLWEDSEINGVQVAELHGYRDGRGGLTELFREDSPVLGDHGNPIWPAMGYASWTRAGVMRGPHEHQAQTDIFVFLGEFTLYLWDNRPQYAPSPRIKYQFTPLRPVRVVVPPGVVHAYRAHGGSEDACLVLNFPDRLYAGWGRGHAVDEIRYEDQVEEHDFHPWD